MVKQYFKELYENTPLPYQSLDIEGNILIVNTAWLKETGYTEDEVIGRPFSNFITKESLVTLQENFPQLCSNGIIHDVEFDIVRKGGSIVHVILDGKVGYTKAGKFKQTHCIYKPSSPEGDGKGTIEPYYHKIFQNSNACMIIFNPNSLQIVDVNRKACDTYGYSYREFVSKNLKDLALYPEETKGRVNDFLAGRFDKVEVYHRLQNGDSICIESHPSLLNVGGSTYVFSIFHDITSKKNSENLLHIQSDIMTSFLKEDETIIFEGVLEKLLQFFKCEHGFVGYINESRELVCPAMTVDVLYNNDVAHEKMTFPESVWGGIWRDSLINNTIHYKSSDLVVPGDHPQLRDALSVPISSGDTVIGAFTVANSKAGLDEKCKVDAKQISEVLSSILSNWRNNLFSRNEILRDRQHLEGLNKDLEIRIEKEVNRRKVQEQVLFEQKKFVDMGQMINAIAHQWRQPLNNIYIVSQVMNDIHCGVDHEFSYDELYRQHSDLVEHMSKTIDDFRHFFSAKKEMSDYLVVQEILATLDLVRAQFDASGINTTVSCRCKDKGVSSSNGDYLSTYCGMGNDLVYGHAGEFRQVILNLLGNAKDALLDKNNVDFPNEIFINISVFDEIDIEIFNYGVPIPETVLPKIFDPYFTTKDEGKGTGIGLYMSKLIIENSLNGSVQCENSEKGVSFRLCIPKKVQNEFT